MEQPHHAFCYTFIIVVARARNVNTRTFWRRQKVFKNAILYYGLRKYYYTRKKDLWKKDILIFKWCSFWWTYTCWRNDLVDIDDLLSIKTLWSFKKRTEDTKCYVYKTDEAAFHKSVLGAYICSGSEFIVIVYYNKTLDLIYYEVNINN